MSTVTEAVSAIASVNGVPLHAPAESITGEALRQRACAELLRQEAQREGLLDAADAPSADGVQSDRATAAIEALLERAVIVPEPDETACRRHYAANEGRFRPGDRVRVRHILFAVTPGTNVVALRNRAETTLLDVRCHDGRAADKFAEAARTQSNCPSGAAGGDLGWLEPRDCAPEFAKEIFGHAEIGVLPRLVHSRFGLHVVEVMEREVGVTPTFEAVHCAVAVSLRQQGYVTALRQYLQLLAGSAALDGIDLDGATTPLVQ